MPRCVFSSSSSLERDCEVVLPSLSVDRRVELQVRSLAGTAKTHNHHDHYGLILAHKCVHSTGKLFPCLPCCCCLLEQKLEDFGVGLPIYFSTSTAHSAPLEGFP